MDLPFELHCAVLAAGACCSELGAQHYGMADEIEFLENYKTHVASTVIMMQVQPPVRTHTAAGCLALTSMDRQVYTLTFMLPVGWHKIHSQLVHIKR